MSRDALEAHLQTGVTNVCRCWAVIRTDGDVLGFTDHDGDLSFDGITFRAETGLTPMAISHTTGLSVDNSEALGALTDSALTEDDIEAGRFDGAEVKSWLVNWQDTQERLLRFRGTIGEIRRTGGAFNAELRGLTEALNQVQGRVYQKLCGAVLGDGQCGFDLTTPGFSYDLTLVAVTDAQVFHVAQDMSSEHWFERGQLKVLTGDAQGLSGLIKHDRFDDDGMRVIELWQPLGADVTAGDTVRVTAGCDRRSETCQNRFSNLLNFRGFPDIPGEDWLMRVPVKAGNNTGGSRR
ncbi:DUF2163 domain-containing protein [Aestuariibius sp. HNIBRBA575]|uniref:DUF2163 domain-containing protein n=1 Tax=Aestuariibius sp. HNIBRBA575 TaxID=3233343 RepID=UPI0034A2C99A